MYPPLLFILYYYQLFSTGLGGFSDGLGGASVPLGVDRPVRGLGGENPVGMGLDQGNTEELCVNGVADDTSPSSPPSSLPPPTLPQYLVEDIICTGLCLLMLDRFLDLGSSSSIVVSPAKEVIVIACMHMYRYTQVSMYKLLISNA